MTRPRLGSPWAVLLAGPVVGTAYFFVVYLLAEAGCADDLDLVGVTAVRIVILVLAAASVGVFVAYALRARALLRAGDGGRAENQRFMATTGLMVLGLFLLFVLFVAAPAIGSSLC